jgi:hypothetical protein
MGITRIIHQQWWTVSLSHLLCPYIIMIHALTTILKMNMHIYVMYCLTSLRVPKIFYPSGIKNYICDIFILRAHACARSNRLSVCWHKNCFIIFILSLLALDTGHKRYIVWVLYLPHLSTSPLLHKLDTIRKGRHVVNFFMQCCMLLSVFFSDKPQHACEVEHVL